MNNKDSNKQAYIEPIVVSSFYSNADGTNAVKIFEITNSNNNFKKLPKKELDELRIENFSSDLFHNLKNFFQGKSSNYNINYKVNYPEKNLNDSTKVINDTSTSFNTAKSITHHTTSDGGMLTVTAFDMSNKKGTDLALQDIIRRQTVSKLEGPKSQSRRTSKLDLIENFKSDSSIHSEEIVNKKKKEKIAKESSNNFTNFNDGTSSLKSPQRFQHKYRYPQPLPQQFCNCIQCRANIRAGLPNYQCDCIDCMTRR